MSRSPSSCGPPKSQNIFNICGSWSVLATKKSHGCLLQFCQGFCVCLPACYLRKKYDSKHKLRGGVFFGYRVTKECSYSLCADIRNLTRPHQTSPTTRKVHKVLPDLVLLRLLRIRHRAAGYRMCEDVIPCYGFMNFVFFKSGNLTPVPKGYITTTEHGKQRVSMRTLRSARW